LKVKATLCIDIYIYLDNTASSDNTLSEISDGRLLPSQIIARGSKGFMKIKCICAAGDTKRYCCRVIFCSIFATVAELLEELNINHNIPDTTIRIKIGAGEERRLWEIKKPELQLKLTTIGIGEEAVVEISQVHNAPTKASGQSLAAPTPAPAPPPAPSATPKKKKSFLNKLGFGGQP